MSFDIKGKIGTVIGAARSGIAVANTIHALGGKAQISEFKSYDAVAKEMQSGVDLNVINIEYGGHTKEFILKSDFLVLSPGVRMDTPPVQWAKAQDIEVMGEIEFSFRLCPCPIIAVTGSNGKTTTVTLICEILRKAGRNAVLCGNIGSPFSKHVLSLQSTDVVVLEISSFQLESTSTFRPNVAVWLNFSQNHLDRHKDLQEYFGAKQKIFSNQNKNDWAVINFAQPDLNNLAKSLNARVRFFNESTTSHSIANPNHLAAMAVADILGIKENVCREVFENFKGVEHRQELVRVLEGVQYINDSKSTTPEAGRWAMMHLPKPLILICGGSDKHLDFSFLKEMVQQCVKHMIVIGETKEQLKQTFDGVVEVSISKTLEAAVIKAQQCAVAGDTVVLSPMCASFDMFNDYEHRGRMFKDIVSELI